MNYDVTGGPIFVNTGDKLPKCMVCGILDVISRSAGSVQGLRYASTDTCAM